MSEEKNLLIKRTDSSVEITVGERDTPTDKNPEDPEDPEEDESCLDSTCCPPLDNACCFRPLTKLQLCILAIIAIVALILALFVIIILVGVIASHAQRLRDLEIKVELLETSNTQMQILAKNMTKNQTNFEKEMRSTIEEAMNQFNIIYIQTLSLFSMKDQLESKVDQLINRTDTFDTKLEQLSNQVQALQPNNTVETSLTSQLDLAMEEVKGHEDQKTKQESGGDCYLNCESVVLCLRFTERGNFMCARPMSALEAEELKYKYLDELQLEYRCHCVNG